MTLFKIYLTGSIAGIWTVISFVFYFSTGPVSLLFSVGIPGVVLSLLAYRLISSTLHWRISFTMRELYDLVTYDNYTQEQLRKFAIEQLGIRLDQGQGVLKGAILQRANVDFLGKFLGKLLRKDDPIKVFIDIGASLNREGKRRLGEDAKNVFYSGVLAGMLDRYPDIYNRLSDFYQGG